MDPGGRDPTRHVRYTQVYSIDYEFFGVHFFFRISKVDEPVRSALKVPESAKYLNLTLMGYGANVSLDFVERFVDDLSGDIKGLISKMKSDDRY